MPKAEEHKYKYIKLEKNVQHFNMIRVDSSLLFWFYCVILLFYHRQKYCYVKLALQREIFKKKKCDKLTSCQELQHLLPLVYDHATAEKFIIIMTDTLWTRSYFPTQSHYYQKQRLRSGFPPLFVTLYHQHHRRRSTFYETVNLEGYS